MPVVSGGRVHLPRISDTSLLVNVQRIRITVAVDVHVSAIEGNGALSSRFVQGVCESIGNAADARALGWGRQHHNEAAVFALAGLLDDPEQQSVAYHAQVR
jgi:hypothetical protein